MWMLYKFYYRKSSNNKSINNTNCDIEWFETEEKAKEKLYICANEYYNHKINEERYPVHYFSQYKPEKNIKHYMFGNMFILGIYQCVPGEKVFMYHRI